MSEKFIPNSERDASIPSDVISIIDAAYTEPDTVKRLAMSDAILVFLNGLQKSHLREAIKNSSLFYKLSGGSVEDVPFDASLAESVRTIDSAITTFVRGELHSLISR
jgi:hypothetical protein